MATTRRSRRRRSRSRIPRPGPHWSMYLGALLLATGVIALSLAAVLTR